MEQNIASLIVMFLIILVVWLSIIISIVYIAFWYLHYYIIPSIIWYNVSFWQLQFNLCGWMRLVKSSVNYHSKCDIYTNANLSKLFFLRLLYNVYGDFLYTIFMFLWASHFKVQTWLYLYHYSSICLKKSIMKKLGHGSCDLISLRKTKIPYRNQSV